ncbi:MAG: acyltransferase [Ferruginibacter sp.]|nr:acyltransferase [Ferruginibacter sp.]
MEAGGNRIYTPYKGRITGFDFLRGIAIFLTLCRHSFHPPNILWQFGWVGVHLFFVLSSFLIANILFTEYYATGKINFFRFFVRRALKIYPLYYLFIFISVYKNRELFLSSIHYKMQLIGQIFHLQNYTDILWYHTWSLAAEEQFYIAMCIMLSVYLLLSKQGRLRKLVWLFTGVIVLAPFLRYRDSLLYHTQWFMPTHLIMDSFAFGALLALSKFVFPKIFSAIIQLKHWLLIPIFILLIPLFFLQAGNLVMNSIGLTAMFLSLSLLLAYLLSVEDFSSGRNSIARAIIQPIAVAGIASYSIYLLHVPVKTFTDYFAISEWLKIPFYFISCIIAGKIAWYFIERPIASYKSRFFSTEK